MVNLNKKYFEKNSITYLLFSHELYIRSSSKLVGILFDMYIMYCVNMNIFLSIEFKDQGNKAVEARSWNRHTPICVFIFAV